jgi:hypothetical protein
MGIGARRSNVPRRRQLPSAAASVIGVALHAAVAAAALWPAAAAAQIASPDATINPLTPSVEVDPNNPNRFRRPGDNKPAEQAPPPGTFTAPSRINATPIYGSPRAFGAGDTGFDSANRSKRKRQAQKPPAAGPTSPQPDTTFTPVAAADAKPAPKPPSRAVRPSAEVHPAKAAVRPGAILPPVPEPLPISNPPPEVHPLTAAKRPGAVLPVPPPVDPDASASSPPPGTPSPNTLPLGASPQRLLPIAEGDAYAPLGLRSGSFLVLPAVEMSVGRDANPEHLPGGNPSAYFVVAPELQVRSDWAVHALWADIRGTYTDYTGSFSPSLNRPYLNAKFGGRIDVSRDTQILLENRYIVATDNPGSPNLSAGLARLPIDTTVGATVGLQQNFSRLFVSVKGLFDRLTYQSSELTDGTTASNSDRNFNQYGGLFRVGYEVNPGFKPFVEVGEDTRIHDEEFDRSGLQRNSDGTTAKVGAAVDLFGTLSGEIGVGYLQRNYQDPTLPMISGVIADGSLTWLATQLTTAKLTAASSSTESILPGVSGALTRDFNVQVDHALRRWLIGTFKVGYGRDEYVGLFRNDNRYFTSVGLTYKMNREVQLKGEIRQDWLTSNVSGVAYTATSFLAGLRLQR